ncbi:MAG: DUF5683 domain-containing protein [Chitinophagales bacterium]|nr:DUF5683 domain-containing protein [Chitinophagales bacterium]
MKSKHNKSIWSIALLYFMLMCTSSHAANFQQTTDSLSTEEQKEAEIIFTNTDSTILETDSTNHIDEIDSITDNQIVKSISEKENDKRKTKVKEEIPLESIYARKAAKWAILPGGGQIFNKRWWKVPIAWGMIGGGGFWIYQNASSMRTYNKALDLRNSGQIDEFANILNEQQLISYRNHYRRNLQLSTFATVGLWGLTVLDAVVDAHLKTYDISDNLSIKIKPKVLRVYNNSVPSVAITLYL